MFIWNIRSAQRSCLFLEIERETYISPDTRVTLLNKGKNFPWKLDMMEVRSRVRSKARSALHDFPWWRGLLTNSAARGPHHGKHFLWVYDSGSSSYQLEVFTSLCLPPHTHITLLPIFWQRTSSNNGLWWSSISLDCLKQNKTKECLFSKALIFIHCGELMRIFCLCFCFEVQSWNWMVLFLL